MRSIAEEFVGRVVELHQGGRRGEAMKFRDLIGLALCVVVIYSLVVGAPPWEW